MKYVIYPAVEPDRLKRLNEADPHAQWINAASALEAEAAMPGTDAFLGKITPAMLARANRLAWVQSFTASLEHYIFPALVEHPLRAHERARALRRRDCRSGDGLRPLFRPQSAHIYSAAARAPLRAGGRRVGARQRAERARDGQCDGSGDDLSSPRLDGDRRYGRNRLRDRAACPGFWYDVYVAWIDFPIERGRPQA